MPTAPSLTMLVLLAHALASSAHAAPYIPKNGSQVVERLPARTDPAQRELSALRAALGKSPSNPALATGLARRYIELARIDGDPRYLGYAQAALAPWWNQPQPPDDVLVLRATLRQSTHQFSAAMADLDTVVARDSGNAQAWLTRATVLSITGDFGAARASCMRLHSHAQALVVQTCLSSVDSVSGKARSGYTALRQALARDPGAQAGVRIWTVTLLAEMATRLGDDHDAEAWFRQALAYDDADSYLLAAYADYLLDHKRAAEVVRLLADKTRADALLLRYALALKATGSPDAARHIGVLRSRFEAAMLRGDTVHQREQARFELSLRADAAAAVRLAKLNWAVQKEPADLRILADAAAASGDREAARLVLAWLKQSGIEDRTIAPAVARLKAPA
jgi:tetratricopeptide (TPR) repeat protein